jgi:hypothetical protein
MGARHIDKVHVMHARGAGRHAGEARKATVDMERRVLVGRLVVLQHVLDEVDPTARTVELVAQQHIGRTGRGAEAAMDASPEDRLGGRDVRIGELRQGEVGLHRRT